MGRSEEEPLRASEDGLEQARKSGKRSDEAREAATHYDQALRDSIVAEVRTGAEETQRRWDRDGRPLWMRVKSALKGHHG